MFKPMLINLHSYRGLWEGECCTRREARAQQLEQFSTSLLITLAAQARTGWSVPRGGSMSTEKRPSTQ